MASLRPPKHPVVLDPFQMPYIFMAEINGGDPITYIHILGAHPPPPNGFDLQFLYPTLIAYRGCGLDFLVTKCVFGGAGL